MAWVQGFVLGDQGSSHQVLAARGYSRPTSNPKPLSGRLHWLWCTGLGRVLHRPKTLPSTALKLFNSESILSRRLRRRRCTRRRTGRRRTRARVPPASGWLSPTACWMACSCARWPATSWPGSTAPSARPSRCVGLCPRPYELCPGGGLPVVLARRHREPAQPRTCDYTLDPDAKPWAWCPKPLIAALDQPDASRAAPAAVLCTGFRVSLDGRFGA